MNTKKQLLLLAKEKIQRLDAQVKEAFQLQRELRGLLKVIENEGGKMPNSHQCFEFRYPTIDGLSSDSRGINQLIELEED
jgi:hypothetical protein